MAYLFFIIIIIIWALVKNSWKQTYNDKLNSGEEQGPSGVDFDGIPFEEKMKAGKK